MKSLAPPGVTRSGALIEPAATAGIVVATRAADPGLVIARAFAAAAATLSLGELFDALMPDPRPVQLDQ